jgi:hypothetical protein
VSDDMKVAFGVVCAGLNFMFLLLSLFSPFLLFIHLIRISAFKTSP